MANEVYELRVVGSVSGQNNECVMHFEGGNLTADDTFENGKSLLDSWHTNLRDLWLGMLPSDYSLGIIYARRVVKPSVVRNKQYVPLGTQIGAFGDGVSSNQLCPSIFLVPQMGTKTGGKVFLPSAPLGGVVLNAYTTPYLTAIENYFNAAIVNFGVSGKTWQQVVYSRKLTTFSLVEGFSISGRFGFQSKRRKMVV